MPQSNPTPTCIRTAHIAGYMQEFRIGSTNTTNVGNYQWIISEITVFEDFVRLFFTEQVVSDKPMELKLSVDIPKSQCVIFWQKEELKTSGTTN